MDESASEVRISPARRIAFLALVGIVTVTLGIMFFGLTSLVLGWFEAEDGPMIPVTDLGYGALLGILITGGVLVQLATPNEGSPACSKPRSGASHCSSQPRSPPIPRTSCRG
jgi:hypothetical protein